MAVEFDDGTADQYQTSALLKARNMSGVYFVNSGRLGLTDEYLSTAQVQALQAAGNEIGGHTAFHLHLPEQSSAEQQRQICTDRDQLLADGLKVTDLAIPFGEFTTTTQSIARQCGYAAVRTSEDASKGFDTLPPANQFQLGAVSSLGDTTTTAYITGAVQKAEQTDTNGGLVQLVFHRVCNVAPCRDSAIRISVFTQVLDWLAAQRAAGLVVVKTLAQALSDGAPRASVSGPAPTATLGVVNSSFEDGSLADGVPTCWEHTTSGDGSTANWSLVQDGHTGTWAQHLDAPVVTSGVGLVVTQDLGSCAAPVVVGDRYSYAVWYKSSAPVQLVAYRRLAAGGYLSFGVSPAFPASPNAWAYATVVTRAVPGRLDRDQHRCLDQERRRVHLRRLRADRCRAAPVHRCSLDRGYERRRQSDFVTAGDPAGGGRPRHGCVRAQFKVGLDRAGCLAAAGRAHARPYRPTPRPSPPPSALVSINANQSGDQ